MGRRAGVTADDTRTELLAAAMRVFAARGYEGARISEIAKEAGVTTGAIYNHYSSKAELLNAAISQRGPELMAELLDGDENVSVLDAFRTVAAVMPEQAPLMSPLLMEAVVASRRDPEVAKVVAGGILDRERERADLIRRGQAAGDVDLDIDADAMARYTTMLLLGSIVVGVLELEPVDRRSWLAVMDRVLDSARPRAGSDASPPTRRPAPRSHTDHDTLITTSGGKDTSP